MKEDENDDDALVEYGKALVEADNIVDALHAFLRVLVHKPTHAETRECITSILRREGGVQMVTYPFFHLPRTWLSLSNSS